MENNLPKISILTPTVRAEGLHLVKQALAYQNFKDYEWIVCSPKRIEKEVRKALGDVEYTYIGAPPLKKWQVWDLNYSYNRMIERANGDLIVSWQDYTFADPDLLNVLWKYYLQDKNSVVSVLGNKYPDDNFDIPAWIDPRYARKEYNWQDIEWNLASIGRDLLRKVGGFAEILDSHYGLDGYNVNHRLVDSKLAHFKLEKECKTYSLFHGRVKDWDKKNFLQSGKAIEYDKIVQKLKDNNSWPYLAGKYLNLR